MDENTPKDTINAPVRRKRRYDPSRRERIIAVTLEAIELYGITGTSTRKVAEMADVSLGSLTYYFEGINQLIEEAFTQLSLSISNEFRDVLGAAKTREEALIAVVDFIDQKIWGSHSTLTLSFELYTFVTRHPQLKSLPQSWMKQSRAALEQHFTPATARVIDAFVEGIGIHNYFDREPMTRTEIERVIRLIASAE
ncbi:TetR/AcrR family transcriptional regulator [uncultured Cedecea sp.]|uniref:TetR/AcrR family transcriptional regulator n=1 Tax=uncultured Cedecea sp. TaxID=988762 RepID=UPI002632AA99|nr:TetR family transcriptional regulator [uncultured Cedecea sp.]